MNTRYLVLELRVGLDVLMVEFGGRKGGSNLVHVGNMLLECGKF